MTACFEMGKVCTGALIVVEQAIQLTEYEMTGIELDCKVSPQVLSIYLNIIHRFMTERLLYEETGLLRLHVTFCCLIQYRNAESKRFFLRKGWRRK